MQKEIEKIIGTVKLPQESWQEFFRNLGRENRIDQKVMIQILAILLDYYEEKDKGK